jgi:hypothetical protein
VFKDDKGSSLHRHIQIYCSHHYTAVTQILKHIWSEILSLQTLPQLSFNLKRSPALKRVFNLNNIRPKLFSIYVEWIYDQKLFTCNKALLHKPTITRLITKQATLNSITASVS